MNATEFADILVSMNLPTEAAAAVDIIARDTGGILCSVDEIASALTHRGEAASVRILGVICTAIGGAQLTIDAVALMVAALASVLEQRKEVDKHPLAYPIGTFSESEALNTEIGEFCMSLAGWNEDILQSLSTAQFNRKFTMRATLCMVVWWLWEQWWYAKRRILPNWAVNFLERSETEDIVGYHLATSKLALRYSW